MTMEAPTDPWSQIQAHCCHACQAMQGRWQDLSRNAQRSVQQASESSQHLMQQVTRASQHFQSSVVAANRRSKAPAFASVFLGNAIRRPQPLFDLASSVAAMKARVAGIPVYTVANKADEFILVTGGETEGDKKQLGLFFFCESDAKDLIQKIHEQNSGLAKDSKVLEVGLDQVYNFSTETPHKGTDGLCFRFMPDAEEVQQALQVLDDQGYNTPGFTGVPVFQAEGLTVKTDTARYTPVFLSKKDLDAAVGRAHVERVKQKIEITQAKVDRAQHEYADAAQQVENAQSKKARAKAQAEADKAQERLAKYSARLEEVRNEGGPKIEVGSLEEVLTKMEKDTDGTWDEVMFIPPGGATKKL